ncbi:TPA: hypothetical protein ACGCGV_004655 [Stenotrophomonas maltophilia]
MSRAPRIVRNLRPTLLVVGEGNAEVELLKMLRDALCGNRQGPSVTIRNARGKGARSVIQDAIRIGRQGSFSKVAALFDTDTDWDDAVRAIGRRAKIQMLTQSPCLEAVLLATNGHHCAGDTAFYKREYQRLYGEEAHRNIREVFVLDNAIASRNRLPEVDALLQMFT